jgi:hypothetical protein
MQKKKTNKNIDLLWHKIKDTQQKGHLSAAGAGCFLLFIDFADHASNDLLCKKILNNFLQFCIFLVSILDICLQKDLMNLKRALWRRHCKIIFVAHCSTNKNWKANFCFVKDAQRHPSLGSDFHQSATTLGI